MPEIGPKNILVYKNKEYIKVNTNGIEDAIKKKLLIFSKPININNSPIKLNVPGKLKFANKKKKKK
jgi:hypothetical protein